MRMTVDFATIIQPLVPLVLPILAAVAAWVGAIWALFLALTGED